MAKNKGVCAICGKGTKLTFEHVPPRATGNDEEARVYGLEDWLNRDADSGEMSGGHVQPQGTGTFSICKSCNEYSGTWYVPEFAKLVHAGNHLLQLIGEAAISEADRSLDVKVVEFEVRRLRALPIVKQVVASLLALNAPTFGQKNPALVRFVLDRRVHELPKTEILQRVLERMPTAEGDGRQRPSDPRILASKSSSRFREGVPVAMCHRPRIRAVQCGFGERATISTVDALHLVEEALDVIGGQLRQADPDQTVRECETLPEAVDFLPHHHAQGGPHTGVAHMSCRNFPNELKSQPNGEPFWNTVIRQGMLDMVSSIGAALPSDGP